LCDHWNNIWCGVQTIALLMLRSPPIPCEVSLRFRCVPQFSLV
jgi:hypothetical protein